MEVEGREDEDEDNDCAGSGGRESSVVLLVRGFFLLLCSASALSLRLRPGAGELSRDAGGEGGRSGGSGLVSGPRICVRS